MRKDADLELKTIMLNNHRVKAFVPKKTISLEEGTKIAREIFKKYR